MPDLPEEDPTLRLLQAAEHGDRRAEDDLAPRAVTQLQHLARRDIAGEPSNHTLTATALVHEAGLERGGGEARRAALDLSWRLDQRPVAGHRHGPLIKRTKRSA